MRGFAKYYLFSLSYVAGVILLEFFPNILTIAVWGLSALACAASVFWILFKKTRVFQKMALVGLLSLPILDMTLGISYNIRNRIKGRIVFSAIDDSFATTKSIVVRQKNDQLIGEYDSSVAGFGGSENANVVIEGDSALVINLTERNYSERLVFDRQNSQIFARGNNSVYRITENKLFR